MFYYFLQDQGHVLLLVTANSVKTKPNGWQICPRDLIMVIKLICLKYK
jgi:hypothetical protein